MVFLRSCDSSSFSLSKEAGLTLQLKPETINGLDVPSFIGKRQQHLFCNAETELSFTPFAENEHAGLVIFQDEKHFYFISKTISNGNSVLQLLKSNADGNTNDVITSVPIDNKKIQLRIDAEGEFYSFYYATEPNKWKVLKDKVDAKFLSTHVAGGFIGSFFGMYATASGKSSTNKASFKYLRYSGKDPMYNKK